MMPSCYSPSCSRPAFYAPNCGGCSAPMYGCASPTYGCAGGYRPEYAPYVYQPSPFISTYGYGAPIPAGTPQYIGIGHHHNVVPSSDAYPTNSSYFSPVAQSIPSIPPLPPAEDVSW